MSLLDEKFLANRPVLESRALLAAYPHPLNTVALSDGTVYDFVANSTKTVDNMLVIAAISAKGTGNWELRIPATLDFSFFGAKGDGVADDTTAILSALASPVTTLTAQNTTAYYKVSNTLTGTNLTKKKLILTGATILTTNNSSKLFAFSGCSNITIEGGEIGWVTTPTANGGNDQHAIQFSTSQNLTVNGLKVRNSPEMGIVFIECNNGKVTNSTLQGCYRDGTHAVYSANITYQNNKYSNIKDDAMAFHDYGLSAQKTFIAGFGYTQAVNFLATGNTVDTCFQGFSSVAGSGITVINNVFRNTVGAGVALMNQINTNVGGTAELTNATVDNNTFFNVCATQTINGVSITNGGQASSGRGAIFASTLGSTNQIDLSQSKRIRNLRVRNNTVISSGALAMHVSLGEGFIHSNNKYMDCVVSGNTLGGSAVEIWNTANYVEESANSVIDTRSTVQHQYGYNLSSVYGVRKDWIVTNRTVGDAQITGGSLKDYSAPGVAQMATLPTQLLTGAFPTADRKPGNYAISTSVTGMPVNGLNWDVAVFHYDAPSQTDQYYQCIAWNIFTGAIYTGYYANTGWMGWKRLLTDSDIHNGTSTQAGGYASYSIPHTLGYVPTTVLVQPNMYANQVTGVLKDATSITVTFAAVVGTGSSNIDFNWFAK